MPRFVLTRPAGIVALVLASFWSGCALAEEIIPYPAAKRIVSVGGTVTEILYALGAEDRVVAVDSTSMHPPQAREKADVGYIRALSPEGIIGQNPDLILLQEGAGPPDALAVLRASGIPLATIKAKPEAQSVSQKIRDVGMTIGLQDKANTLADKAGTDLDAAISANAKRQDGKKRVLFVLSLANGRVMAGGRNTEPAALIEMAGGLNAAQEISGYKPMSDEAIIAARPDFVLVMENGNHRFTPEQVFGYPAFASSPAAQNKALLGMDGLLLTGFGPRTADAVRALSEKLYGSD